MESILSLFASSVHDCSRSNSIFSGVYEKLLCELTRQKYPRRQIVSHIPDGSMDCRSPPVYVLERSTGTWSHCCNRMVGLFRSGDMLCEHTEPLYTIQPTITDGNGDDMAQQMMRMFGVIRQAFTFMEDHLPKSERFFPKMITPSVKNETNTDEKPTICFMNQPPDMYASDKCFCWKGKEECSDHPDIFMID